MTLERAKHGARAARLRMRRAGWWLTLACLALGQAAHAQPAQAPAPANAEVPAHNRADLVEPPPRPAVGDAEAKARALFTAIQRDDPDLAKDFFFPREAFLLVKAIPDPGKYWDKLFARYRDDIRALHRDLPDLEHAEFERLELVKRGGWVKVKEEGNHLPYWVSRHSYLHYRVGQRREKFEVRVLITWDDHWYITHLSEFH